MTLPASLKLRRALEDLLEESGLFVECAKAGECFSDGQWGWLAYDDPLNNTAGGKPWGECHCATEVQRRAAEVLLGKDTANGGKSV